MNGSHDIKPESGVDDFFGIFKSYNKIIVWALGAAAAPIAAGMAKLAPPWPPAIIQLTALFEILVLIVSFQFLKKSASSFINRIIVNFISMFFVTSIVYLAFLSTFVYIEPISGERFIKGFSCTSDAIRVFPDACPFFTDENLRTAEWEAARLWQPWSITVIRITLVVLWVAIFGSISASIGSFLVYQSSVRTRIPT